MNRDRDITMSATIIDSERDDKADVNGTRRRKRGEEKKRGVRERMAECYMEDWGTQVYLFNSLCKCRSKLQELVGFWMNLSQILKLQTLQWQVFPGQAFK